jgi:hypothetical protein
MPAAVRTKSTPLCRKVAEQVSSSGSRTRQGMTAEKVREAFRARATGHHDMGGRHIKRQTTTSIR